MQDEEVGFNEEKEVIETKLADVDFVMYMLMNWANYSKKQAKRIVEATDSSKWLNDELETTGFTVYENSMFNSADCLLFRKVDPHQWVVEGFSALEMKELVENLK